MIRLAHYIMECDNQYGARYKVIAPTIREAFMFPENEIIFGGSIAIW